MFKKSRTTIANGLKLTQVGYEHTPVEPPENKYEEDYGDEHTHTYHLHDGDNHIATIVHKTTDGGFPTSIMYHQHENGRQTLTNYGAPRYTNIDAYTSRFKWLPRHENQDMHKTNMELVKHAVNAFVTSKTGSKWAFGTKYKLPPESKSESTLMGKVLDILNEVNDDPIDHKAEADYLEKAKDEDILKWAGGKVSLKDAKAHHRQMIAYHRQRAAIK